MSRRSRAGSPTRRSSGEQPHTTSAYSPARDFQAVAPLAADIRGRLDRPTPADD